MNDENISHHSSPWTLRWTQWLGGTWRLSVMEREWADLRCRKENTLNILQQESQTVQSLVTRHLMFQFSSWTFSTTLKLSPFELPINMKSLDILNVPLYMEVLLTLVYRLHFLSLCYAFFSFCTGPEGGCPSVEFQE